MRFARAGDDPKMPTWRLVLEEEHDGDGLITIQQELATSTADTAVTMTVLGAVDLSEDEARWLYESLGKILTNRRRMAMAGVKEGLT